ncbi:hypothetical protein [Erwinia psidii]|uniref:hypothetical protein n=1 Tax=Erwinia psidii TaxID=69224 RepID=UPI0013159DC8|nr:hypothetical protein [Erwinia psidii]
MDDFATSQAVRKYTIVMSKLKNCLNIKNENEESNQINKGNNGGWKMSELA